MELKKVHEDKRGFIYVISDLLNERREFTILEIKKARERIKKGEFYTEEEAKKILRLSKSP